MKDRKIRTGEAEARDQPTGRRGANGLQPRIGYACIAIGVPGTELRTCQAARATPQLLDELVAHNLRSLGRMLDWNARNGIRLFRVSSDLIPFGSSPVNRLPWWETHADAFAALAEKARAAGIRLSMHPGQYTVLNAKDPDIVRRAVDDLVYHERVLSLLGQGPEGKIILHAGGVYGDRKAALQRFADAWRHLDDCVRARLVIENDEKCHPIADVLALGTKLGIPVVYDNLHNAILPSDPARTDADWIAACAPTWRAADGRQKIHYSQQAQGKAPGAHAATIEPEAFLSYVRALSDGAVPAAATAAPDARLAPVDPLPDIMLEVKDKNLSAVKCALCLAGTGVMRALEHQWARYKYTVLEHAPNTYLQIRKLLSDKTASPALAFHKLVDEALAEPVTAGNAENAALHVWGYFKDKASSQERSTFDRAIARLRATGSPAAAKRVLLSLAQTHADAYLLDSLYFFL